MRNPRDTKTVEILGCLYLALFPGCGAGVDSRPGPDPLSLTLESLSAHRVPLWFQDARFGIFSHGGPYSVPAFADLLPAEIFPS